MTSRLVLTMMACLALAGGARAAATEKPPPGVKLTRLEVRPVRVTLTNPFAYSRLLVTAVLSDGDRLDASRMVDIEAPGKLVKVTANGLVRPLADGEGVIKIKLGNLVVDVPLVVTGQTVDPEISFMADVMPILARLGCNAGTCHGAEAGKNGFKLSLRGYDPLFDHRALVDDLSGRRFNRAAPDTSLMLLKISGGVPHVGGVLVSADDPYYRILRAWIAGGVRYDSNGPRVRSIEVVPVTATLQLPGNKQQIAVYATFSDGKVRDVTLEAFLESSNTDVATVDRGAVVTAVRRGEATIMARYEGAYAATPLIIMGNRTGFVWPNPPEYNWIDTLVYDKLKLVKVQPSDVCTDGEFVRRLHLDLTGVPPGPDEVRAFLNDPTPSKIKREKLVDKLIGNDDFVEHWTNKWADLLQVNRKFLGDAGARGFRGYIRKAVASNTPYDQFVHSILTASGSNIDNPAASYFKVLRTPDAIMENTTQLFLAVRFNCNKCHDHPFERWTQDQYYQLSAYFADVRLREDGKFKGQKIGSGVEGVRPLVEIISDVKGGVVKHQRTGTAVQPVFPYEHADKANEKATRREELAKWLTSKDNQYFARSYVNRIWAYLTGVGLIEPIDDIRAGNPPTNPKLLDRLTEEFIKSGFDTRHMMKLICKSRTYQHSVASNKWNDDDTLNYSRATPRRLSAEALYDAIHKATGSLSRLPGLPAGARAAQLLDSTQDVPGGFLDLFGKPPRESACECERTTSTALGPVLNMVNGPVVGEALRDPNNRLVTLLKTEKDNRKIVESMYLSFISRLPTAKEMNAALDAIRDGEEDYDKMVADSKQRRDTLVAYEKTQPERQKAWESNLHRKPEWKPVEVVKATAKSKAKLEVQKDGSILVSGEVGNPELYTVVVKTAEKGITAVRLEVLPDKSLPANGPGRAQNGNFVLQELRLNALEVETKGKGAPVPLHRAQATFEQGGFPIGNAIDNNLATGWAIANRFGQPTEAMFELRTPLSHPKGTLMTFVFDQRFGTNHVIGKFRLSVTTTPPPLSLSGPPPHLSAIIAIEAAKRTPEQKATLEAAFRAQDTELARLQGEVSRYPMPVDKRHPGLQDLGWALINSNAFQFNH